MTNATNSEVKNFMTIQTVGASKRSHKTGHNPFNSVEGKDRYLRSQLSCTNNFDYELKQTGRTAEEQLAFVNNELRKINKQEDAKIEKQRAHVVPTSEIEEAVNQARLEVNGFCDGLVKSKAEKAGCSVEEIQRANWEFIQQHDPKLYKRLKSEQRKDGETVEDYKQRMAAESELAFQELTARMAKFRDRRSDNPNAFYNFDFMEESVTTPLKRKIYYAGRGYAKVLNFSYAKANSKNPNHIYVYYKAHKGDRRGEYVGKITPDYEFVIGFKLPNGVTPVMVETALMNCLYGMYDHEKAVVHKHFND